MAQEHKRGLNLAQGLNHWLNYAQNEHDSSHTQIKVQYHGHTQ